MATTKTTMGKKKHTQQNDSNGNAQKDVIQYSQLKKLFEDGLKDIYWAEIALTKALPKMINIATSEELIDALANHLSETEVHIERAEKIFGILNMNPEAIKCLGMEGLIKEGEGIIAECDEGSMMDAAIIAASLKIDHYEIASYCTLLTFAETLIIEEVVQLLEVTLEEERMAEDKLTEVAVLNGMVVPIRRLGMF